MIALDTNLLVYAHRADLRWHAQAKALLAGLFDGDDAWGLPVPCVHEFLAVVTRLPNPTPTLHAMEQVREWLRSPSAQLLHSTNRHLDTLAKVIEDGQAKGGQIHDARIAAICLEHGANELWTVDRDFARFGMLTSRNPLVQA
jgi:uncharacterized protein